MATFITVAQQAAAQLLEANRRQTAVNREGLAVQAKQAAAAEPVPPQQVNPRRRVVMQSDDLAAFRLGGVLLLLHFDGDNGSAGFVDSGRYRLPVVASGDVLLSSAQSKFGGTSAFFNGRYVEADSASTGGSLLLSDARLSLDELDFTVEFWIYPDSNTGDQFDQPLLVFPEASNGGIWGQANVEGFQLSWIVGAPADNVYNELDVALPYDQWHHLAYVRSGGVVSTFANGIKQTGTYSTISQPGLSIAQLQLGTAAFNTGEQFFLRAYLDELRVVKGKAVYATDFTPPTGPFSSRQP